MTKAKKLDDRTRALLLAGAIVLLALAAYVPALRAGWVWDDDFYVTDNQTLRDLGGLVRIWTQTDANPQYYPLTYTSFWIDHHLFGVRPFGYHLENVLLHAMAAILAWRALRLLGVPGAWLAAAVFAVHPVHVESVAWVTERKNTLCAVFSFASAIVYLRFALADPRRPAARSLPWIALGLFVAALLSKSACAPFPVALAAIVLWKQGTVSRRNGAWLLAMLALAAVAGSVTAVIESKQVGAQGAAFSLSLVERSLLAPRVLWIHLSNVLWPANLMFVYPRPEASLSDPWTYVLPIAFLGALAALVALRPRIGGGPLAGAAYYVLLLSPALGFFNVFAMQYSYVMDHFQYLATIGAIAVAVVGLVTVGDRFSSGVPLLAAPRLRAMAGLALLAALSVLTWKQCGIYRDEETLWRDTIAKNSAAWLAQFNLGKILERRGDADEAALRYREALAANPRLPDALTGLANIVAGQGKLDEAIGLYRRVTEISPRQPFARYNLGLALETKGDAAGAIEEYRAVLALVPDPSKLPSEFQAALFRSGGFGTLLEKTRSHLDGLLGASRTEATGGADATALVREGNALADRGRLAEAVARYEQALALEPRNALAHYNLALAEEAMGDEASAIAHYAKAIEVAPTLGGAHNNLAVLLYRRGDYAGAWKEARLAERNGVAPNEDFLRALAEKLPEPGD